jgi:hypothetical protein
MESILQFFERERSPLTGMGSAFYLLARDIVEKLPRNPERTVALRKLLEAKEAAMRAATYIEPASGSRG